MSRREVSLVDLRRLHYGELLGSELERVRASVERDPELRRRLESIRREEEAFFRQTNVAAASAEILARWEAETAPGRIGRPRLLWGGLMAVVATAAVVFSISTRTPTTRTKGGGPSIEMVVKDAQGVRPGQDGIRLREGDRIQLRYHAVGKRHLMVVSVDSRGVVSPFYPERPGSSIEIEPSGFHFLEGSIILDDARGPEQILALFSDAPLSYAEVKRAADEAKERVVDVTALPLLELERDDVEEERVLIVKE